jgi:hypothetical protein
VYSFAAKLQTPRSSDFSSSIADEASRRSASNLVAYSRSNSPAAVSEPSLAARSSSTSPTDSSSFRITWLIAGCVRCSRTAAREKLRSSATARNVSN